MTGVGGLSCQSVMEGIVMGLCSLETATRCENEACGSVSRPNSACHDWSEFWRIESVPWSVGEGRRVLEPHHSPHHHKRL